MLSYEAARKVLDLQLQFGHLAFLRHDGFEVVFKPLPIAMVQLATSQSHVAEWIIQDWVVEKAVLYHTKGMDWLLNGSPAGLVPRLANSILKFSAPDSEEKIVKAIAEKRVEAGTLLRETESLICHAFHCDPREVRALTLPEQIDRLVLAEAMTGNKLQIQDKDAPAAKKSRGPRIPPGYQSTGSEGILSPHAADKPNFAADNKALSDL